jgi:GNAT superfamily N-acetyltransferase
MRIRQATTADEAAIAVVYVAARRAGWRAIVDAAYLDSLDVEKEATDLRTRLAPREEGWVVLVAEDDETIVGFVTFVADRASRVGHVGALFVSLDRFESGIGTSLLDAAAGALADDGCEKAILWTLEDDRSLLGFYQRRGWEPDGGRQFIELDQSRAVLRLRKSLRSPSAQ